MIKILGLFPGQGSQKVGMGADLIQSFDIAKEIFAKADHSLGFSLSKACIDGPTEDLQRTEITQPAILTVSTICFLVLQEMIKHPIQLCAAAGHSLGEYSALVAAGAISFEDAVVLVNKRGRYMQEAVPAGEGKMLAVLGLELEELEEKLSKYNQEIEIANVNTPGQIVVAGRASSISKLAAEMTNVKTVELAVSAPFHCSMMKPAEEKLKGDLEFLKINPPNFPIISNFSAQPLTQTEAIRESLVKQVCGQVKWVQSIETAISGYSPDLAIEFGSGNVLTGMLKRINSDLKRLNANGTEAIKKIVAEISG